MAHRTNENILNGLGRPPKDKPELAKYAQTEVGTSLRNFTIEDVELALRILAYNGTSYTTTSRILEEDYSISVHTSTLKRWATSHFANRYVAIQQSLDQEISQKLSGELTDVAIRASDVQKQVIDKLNQNLNDLETKDLSATAKNLSQVINPAIEKTQLLRGKPTERTESKDAEKIIAKLAEMGLVKNAQSLDIDIDDAEVIED